MCNISTLVLCDVIILRKKEGGKVENQSSFGIDWIRKEEEDRTGVTLSIQVHR